MTIALKEHHRDLLKSLFSMAVMVEARDPYTGGHLWRVSQFSRQLAKGLGLAANDVARITLAGFLHDLGKIGVPDAVLRKPGPLTDDEYALMKTHTDIGGRLLANHPLESLVVQGVVQHHETPDGSGYPHGLKGSEISLDGRIIGVCDAFDAMTSTRPYRRGMPIDTALALIEGKMGSQFDTDVAIRFLAMGKRNELDHIVGHSDEGIPLQVCGMCGPTIVVKREQQSGDHLFCRNCGGEAVLEKQGAILRIRHTGKQGSAADLEAEVDHPLIERILGDLSPALAA